MLLILKVQQTNTAEIPVTYFIRDPSPLSVFRSIALCSAATGAFAKL